MYVLTVTETLEAWEDSVNIGTVSRSCLSWLFADALVCICLLAPLTSLSRTASRYLCEGQYRAGPLYGAYRGMRWQQVPINLGHWCELRRLLCLQYVKAVSSVDARIQPQPAACILHILYITASATCATFLFWEPKEATARAASIFAHTLSIKSPLEALISLTSYTDKLAEDAVWTWTWVLVIPKNHRLVLR